MTNDCGIKSDRQSSIEKDTVQITLSKGSMMMILQMSIWKALHIIKDDYEYKVSDGDSLNVFSPGKTSNLK